MDEVRKHNKENDLWLCIHGKIYDVTKFKEDHPGGPEILLTKGGRRFFHFWLVLTKRAGMDATDELEEVFHSEAARP